MPPPPPLSEAEQRRLLSNFGVVVESDTANADADALPATLHRSIKRSQDLAKHGLHESDGVDPSTLLQLVDTTQLETIFGGPSVFSLMELSTRASRGNDRMWASGNAFAEVREALWGMTRTLPGALAAPVPCRDAAGRPLARIIYQAPGGGAVALLLEVHSVRELPAQAPEVAEPGEKGRPLDGSALIEVRWLLNALQTLPGDEKQRQMELKQAWVKSGAQIIKAQSADDVMLMKEVLVHNGLVLPEAYRQAVETSGCGEAGKPCGGEFSASFIVPLRPLPVDKRNPVSLCMVCRLPAKKTCSRCGKAKYCSAECQRSHWKEHKVDCKAGPATQQGGASEPAACTSPTGPGVVIDLSSQPADKTHALAVSLHQAVSKAIAAKPTNNAGLLPNVHGSEFFLIKVQTPVRPTDPILIYDKQRSFTLPLCIEQVDAHKSLAAAVIASRNPVKKAYMWAKRESDMELRVYTDARDLPSQTGNAVSW